MYPHPFALLIRLLLSLGGVAFAIGFPLVYGYKQSYSRYFEDDSLVFCSVLFLLAVGLFMHKNKKWTIPSGSLMLVASFDMFSMPIVHYSAAFVFFLFSSLAMLGDKRINGFGKVSFLLYPLLFWDLIFFELFQVLIICLFHIVYIIKTFFLMRRKNS